MEDYQVVKIRSTNKKQNEQVSQLLKKEKIRRDENLDYTCGIFNEVGELIATGSCFKNTLRCIAVDDAYHGQGFMNKLITHLNNVQFERGNFHVFLYTKSSCREQFQDLGYYEIAYVDNLVVFMENKKDGFKKYLESLNKKVESTDKNIASIVMNCNPFTLGHQYLIEKVAKENDHVHIFVVEEDVSVFPFHVRKDLVEKGTAQLDNVSIHTTGPYLISSATFPAYFQKDKDSIIKSQIEVDAKVFVHIAKQLGINRRYVGTEPYSHVTKLYNDGLQKALESSGISLIIEERKELVDEAISASRVREFLKNEQWDKVKQYVPNTTYEFLISNEAREVLEALKIMNDVKHY